MNEHEDAFWFRVITLTLGKISKTKLKRLTNDDLLLVKCLFEKASGSWEDLAGGSADQWSLLRTCCKISLKALLE